jgi:2,5-diketo-D-gluconate reductase A
LQNAQLFDETVRLLSETEQRAQELAIINSVQEGLASKLDMQAIFDLVGDSPAQINLRWHLDLGNVLIPKSVNAERMAANIDLYRIRLDDEDHAQIAGLEAGQRIGPDPDQFNG